MTDQLPEHSDTLGGSTASRRIHCPGSHALEAAVPKPKRASDSAERGTGLHMAMEDLLLNCEGEPVNCQEGIEYNGILIDQQLIDEKLQPAMTALDEIIVAAGGDMDFMIEVKGSLNSIIPGAFGTVDILGKGADKRLWVIDWKFGDGVKVSPVENFQMAFYAACALYDEDPEVREMVGNDEQALDIVFVIVQPRPGRDEPVWEMWETDDMWVEKFLDLAVAANDAMLKPNAPLAMGEWCRFCRAKTDCPLQNSQAVSVLENTVAPVNMDAITMADWLGKAEQIEQFIKELREHVHTELERGVKIPGYKVVNKQGRRVYNDVDKATALLVRQLKTEEAHKPREAISPAQAEKKLGKTKYNKLMSKYVSMVSSGTTIALATDKRQDVSDPSQNLGDKLRASLGENALTQQTKDES